MDAHRPAEERSPAYHRALAGRLREHPEILQLAHRRVAGWLASSAPIPTAATLWADVLARHVGAIAAFLVERSECATELHQSSPFAGALSPRARWQIWRDTRARLSRQP